MTTYTFIVRYENELKRIVCKGEDEYKNAMEFFRVFRYEIIQIEEWYEK